MAIILHRHGPSKDFSILNINYKKVGRPLFMKSGYVDVREVAERYKNSPATPRDIKRILKDHAVKDSLFFLQEECTEYAHDFKKISSLLDVGSGTGMYSYVFSKSNLFKKNFKYTGTEINDIFVNICKNNYPEENFVVSYANDLPFCNKSFDLTYCSSTLHYALKNWKRSLNEMKRITKKFLIIVRFPLTKYNHTFYVCQTVKTQSSTEKHYFIVINRKEFENYLKEHKLEILKRDFSGERFRIDGVEEEIVYHQYLLKVG